MKDNILTKKFFTLIIEVGELYKLSENFQNYQEEVQVMAMMGSIGDMFKDTVDSITKDIKQTVTIELDTEVMNYFKTMASNTSIPAETIMRMYLTECMKNNKQLKVSWE